MRNCCPTCGCDATTQEYRLRYEILAKGLVITPEVAESIKSLANHAVKLSVESGMSLSEATEALSYVINRFQSPK